MCLIEFVYSYKSVSWIYVQEIVNVNTTRKNASIYFFFSNYLWCFARLVPFVQIKKRKKHPWKSVTFSKLF